MSPDRLQIETAIAALESQRALLGDAVVDASLGALRSRLAALEPAAVQPEQTLRQVTILFLDVVGSTQLSHRLDPESISAVMDDVLRRGTAVVEAHRGKVLQYAGDNILAAFGVAGASEDDTERAVRCGLGLLELGKVLGAEVQAAHGHAGFDVRVGIHTGGVLLGGGVDAEGSIRGIAVNVAARMEQSAPPGGLRISHAAYAQVRGLFDVEVQPPLAVKGVDEPVLSYLVNRAKPRNFRIGTRGIEGVATRMIGRDAELELLQEAFKRLYAERRLAVVTVVGDAGVGKSRLLYEFEAWAETRPESFYIFRGRATPQTQGQPFGLLRDILAWRLQIADDDTLAVARAKLEQGIVPLFVDDDGADLAEGHAHLLGHLIGIEWRDSRHVKGILDDPRQIRNRAFHVAAQMFRRVSAGDGNPVVLELEDLHWADNESLDFLAYLCEIDRDLPLLMLAFGRPLLFERRSAWCAEAIHQRIELAALDKRASRDLAAELLKKLPEVPAALRELITSGSEGNPFYMEELVRMLIDQRAIQTGDTWKVNAERLLLTQVPSTLTGVLQARLDGLAAAEKLALQEASVIGPVFWDRALIALDQRAEQVLPRLVQRELALPRFNAGDSADGGTDGLREYAFKHAVLHQVTYATVLKRTRLELHGKLARWLAAQTGLRANDFLAAAAEHFEQAGDGRNAAEFHARAAEQAQTRMAHEAVLKHVQRGLELAAKLPEAESRPLRWRLLVAREATLEVQGERSPQRQDVEALRALADAMGDEQRRAHAAWRRGILFWRTDDFPAMEAAAREAMASATAAGDDELRLTAQRMLAVARVGQGDLDAGTALAQAALSEAQTLGLAKVTRLCLNCLALIAQRKRDDKGSLDLIQQSIAVLIGDPRGEAIARGNLGVAWANLGELDRGRAELETALRLLRANGDRQGQCAPLSALSGVALQQGDDARALALARATLETAQAVQARAWEMDALVRLGAAECALGRYAEAEAAYRHARERAIAMAHPWQHEASGGLARVALARGDIAAALSEVEALLDQVGPGMPAEQHSSREIELTCYRVLAAAGAAYAGRAADTLARAHDNLQAEARRITDVRLRQCFLQNLQEHRDIVAAWERRERHSVADDAGFEPAVHPIKSTT